LLNARKSAVKRVGEGLVRPCFGELAEHLRKQSNTH